MKTFLKVFKVSLNKLIDFQGFQGSLCCTQGFQGPAYTLGSYMLLLILPRVFNNSTQGHSLCLELKTRPENENLRPLHDGGMFEVFSVQISFHYLFLNTLIRFFWDILYMVNIAYLSYPSFKWFKNITGRQIRHHSKPDAQKT